MVVTSLPGAASLDRMDSLHSARKTRNASFCSCAATLSWRGPPLLPPPGSPACAANVWSLAAALAA